MCVSGYWFDLVIMGGFSVYDECSGVLCDDGCVIWEDDYVGCLVDDNLLVVNVLWNDVKVYVDWLSKCIGKVY